MNVAQIDVVVPTVEGREESLARFIASVEKHVPDYRLIVIRDVPTCGIGWREGIKKSSAPYILLSADDIELDSGLEPCVEAVDDGYLPAPIVYRPNGTVESAGGDMNSPACLITEIQPDWTPVDFTPMPFWSRAQARKIRMIPAHYLTDTWVSHRGRQLGYETVLRHDYKLIHHHEMVGRITPNNADDAIYRQAMKDAQDA